MLKSSSCDYINAYILVKKTMKTTGEGADDAAKQTYKKEKEVIFKRCASFIYYISDKYNSAKIILKKIMKRT